MTRALGLVALLSIALGCSSTGPLTVSAPEWTEPPSEPGSDPAGDPRRGHDFEAPPADDRRGDGLFAYTEPGELPQLIVAGDEDGARLPLEHTDVAARVRGYVAHVRVAQRFVNDGKVPTEVTYTFPLPENAAVDDMRMVIGERVIHSEVRTRARARETYEDARAAGHTAALLEQERPNIFTQSVANVAPGEAIEVELSYLQTLTQDAGTYEFVFPMVVGPRFIPGGTGTKAGIDVVPDASRITPPILGEGERSGNDVSLTLDVDAGISIDSWAAPTHTVTGLATTSGFSARLADAQTIPNRDFVIRWEAAATEARASLFLGAKDSAGEGHFALLVQPPQLELDALVGRREMIFVIDRSGSMSGVPLALAKGTLREALRRLRPVDSFDVVGFESGTERLFGTPRPASEHNLVLAERFIDGMTAGGGTMMADAVEAALAPRIADGGRRYVFFLTDGFIGNEEQIFTGAAALVARAAQVGGRSRVFGLGIGSSPNRELIAGLAKAGDGIPLYVSNREQPAAVVDSYYRYVDHPVLEELRVDWGGLEVDSLYPSELPDLFASHTVVMHGRYAGELQGEVRLYASAPGRRDQIELALSVSPSALDDRILSTLWAREKIADLTSETWGAGLDPAEAAREITSVGLEYHLVTAYTSFVAVDRSRVVGDGNPVHLTQPVEVPEDVDPIMSGAAGISLAGTSGAESMYSVDGANIEMLSVSRARQYSSAVALEYSEPGHVGGSWADEGKLKIGKLRGSEGVSKRELERALRRRDVMFEACYVQHGQTGKRRLSYRLDFDARGILIAITLISGTLGSDLGDGCVEAVLRRVEWAGLPGAAATVEVELVLQLR